MNPTSSLSLPSSYPRYDLITEAANTVNAELCLFSDDDDDGFDTAPNSDSERPNDKKKTKTISNPAQLEQELLFLRSSLDYFYSRNVFPFSNESATEDFVTAFLPLTPSEFKRKNQTFKTRYKKRMWRVCKKFELLEDTREQEAFELGNMIWGAMGVNQEEKVELKEENAAADDDAAADDEGSVVLDKFPLLKKKFELKNGVIKMPVVWWKGLKVQTSDDDDDRVMKEWEKQQIEALKRFLSKISLARLYTITLLDNLVQESQERRASSVAGSSNDKRRCEILPQDLNISHLNQLSVKSLSGPTNPVSENLHHSLQNPSLIFQQTAAYLGGHQPKFSSSFFLMGSDLKLHPFRYIDFGLPDALIIGSYNGLLCLRHNSATVSLCNPATRQATEVPMIDIDDDDDCRSLQFAFGYSAVVNDYKILAIHSVSNQVQEIFENNHVDKVEVYSLATGSWSGVDASNLQTVDLDKDYVTVQGSIVWMAMRCYVTEPEFLVSYDIEKEVFTELKCPPKHFPPRIVMHNKLVEYKEKLGMFHQFEMESSGSSRIDLWVLDSDNHHADGQRWIKQYRVGPFTKILNPLNILGDEIVCREEFARHNLPVEEHPYYLFNPKSNELRILPTKRDRTRQDSLIYAGNLVPYGRPSQH